MIGVGIIEVDVLFASGENDPLGAYVCGDESVLHPGVFWVPSGAPPAECGLHPLPRATER